MVGVVVLCQFLLSIDQSVANWVVALVAVVFRVRSKQPGLLMKEEAATTMHVCG